MFTSTIRRAAALTAQPYHLSSSAICAVPRAATAEALSASLQQRRYSSSKPSNPADGPEGLTQGEKEAAVQAQKAESKNAKRKSPKEVAAACTVKGRDESMQNLPTVPSTHHLKPKDVSASSFFSLHRPLSVTSCWPKAVTQETFDSIFTPRSRETKTKEIIATLSNSIAKLELDADPDIRHLDDPNERMKFPRHIMTGRYQPFNTPPPPVPMDTEESLAAGLEAAEEAEQSQHRTYTAVLTVEESTDANGEVSYKAHSTPLELEDQEVIAPSFLERMQSRRERYEEYREQRAETSGMWAISVKRQRKLKMKKHKYKKLMKRTRNLRRRIERA